MNKVSDLEAPETTSEPGWATALRSGYLKESGPVGYSKTKETKNASGKHSPEEELKLLGSVTNSPGGASPKPKIMSSSGANARGNQLVVASSKDDDLLDTSANATLTYNGLPGLDDHTTTYTGTINSLSRLKNRFSSKYGRMRKRVVFKNGDTNLHQTNISKKRRKYLSDLFITLVDLQVRTHTHC